MTDNSIKELIDSFVAYRELLAPLQESLTAVSKTYGEIRDDLDSLQKNLSGNAAGQLERVHSLLNSQAKSGQELAKSVAEYSKSGERFANAVNEVSTSFADVAKRITSLEETERAARSQIERIDALIEEKKAAYNLKDLQKSLDRYNLNIEKISDFINRDIAAVMKQNADKIENIRKENEELKAIVLQQSKDIAALAQSFVETTALLKTTVEGSSVNEQYLFDAFDKWAAERKVKIVKK